MDGGHNDPNQAVLSEAELKHMSQHVKDIIPSTDSEYGSEESSNNLTSTLGRVYDAAESKDITATHRVAAWNTLCALVDQCLKHDALADMLWLHGLVNRAFELYIRQSHKARPKSSKQLLTTLSSAFGMKHNHHNRRSYAARRLMHGIFSGDACYRSKSCLQALAHFLRKDVLPLEDVLRCLDASRSGEDSSNDSRFQELLRGIILKVCDGDLGSAVSQVIDVVLDKAAGSGRPGIHGATVHRIDSAREAIWMQPLELVVSCGNVPIDELRFHILPALFRRNLSEYMQFLERHGLPKTNIEGSEKRLEGLQSSVLDLDLLCAGLQVGKELGLLLETDDVTVTRTASSILVPVRWIGRLLSHSSRRARLTGFSLLITSHSATRPFSALTLKFTRRHLHIFFADTDANFRSEVFSLLQRLMDRFRAVTAVLARKSASHGEDSSRTSVPAQKSLEEHVSFLEWLVRFLSWELRPTASYQRHISALKTLLILARSGVDKAVPLESLSKSAHAESKWPFEIRVVDAGLRCLLLDLVLNPFEDVRQAAFSLLFTFQKSKQDGGSVCREVSESIRRAEHRMLSTGRADQADGVAYLYALLYKQNKAQSEPTRSDMLKHSQLITHLIESLERMLGVAESGLTAAVEKYPAYGLFTSLRYLLIHNDAVFDSADSVPRLIRCLHQIWNIVRPVLCDDAPEGYLPEDNEDTTAMTTKDILSYCWRGLKESSLLLEALVSKGNLCSRDVALLTDLSFTQLAELRHRGAFSTVAQTWATCCIHCSAIPSNGQGSGTREAYERVLDVLRSRTTINTRRSAGLPALFCGVLISNTSGELVDDAFNELGAISRQLVEQTSVQEGSLPQVHALNCIKDILKHSRLRQHSERYIPGALRLAADSLRSSVWAIRNCGLMLFRAAIDRLFGTSDSYLEDEGPTPCRMKITQHADMLDTVLDLLVLPDESNDTLSANRSEGVFPALQLLQRTSIPEGKLSLATTRVHALTGNSSWHIRDKAARTYASLVAGSSIELNVEDLLGCGVAHQNALHGALLCIKYVVRQLSISNHSSSLRHVANAVSEVSARLCIVIEIASTLTSSSHLYHENSCAITKAAYVDALVEVAEFARKAETNEEAERVVEICRTSRLDILREFERTLNDNTWHSGIAVLRVALAHALGCGLHAVTGESLIEHLLPRLTIQLAEQDSDACIALLRANSERRLGLHEHSMPATTMLEASRTILEGDFGVSLRCEVLRSLLWFKERHSTTQNEADLTMFAEVCLAAPSPTIGQADQQYADLWLELIAVGIESHFAMLTSTDEELERTLSAWMEAWRLAVHGQGLCSTDAAASSIVHLENTLRYMRRSNPACFRDLCLGIYDLLNDDDKEVRLLAAQAASRLLNHDSNTTFNRQLEPIVASQYLIKFMVREWNDNAGFIEEVIARALGVDESDRLDVDTQLARADSAHASLFAEEKQNLYIDDAREAKVWSSAMLELEASRVPSTTLRRLAHWIAAGLDVLVEKAQSSVDNAPGWTNKADVFVLGLQSIYGAEFLLRAAEQGRRLPIRPSYIRTKLGRLLVLAASGLTNALWHREIERVLSGAVVNKVRQTQRVISEIDKSILR